MIDDEWCRSYYDHLEGTYLRFPPLVCVVERITKSHFSRFGILICTSADSWLILLECFRDLNGLMNHLYNCTSTHTHLDLQTPRFYDRLHPSGSPCVLSKLYLNTTFILNTHMLIIILTQQSQHTEGGVELWQCAGITALKGWYVG